MQFNWVSFIVYKKMEIRAGEKCKTSKRNWQTIKSVFKSACLVRCMDIWNGVEKDGWKCGAGE